MNSRFSTFTTASRSDDPELDTYRSARLLVQQHGEDAPIEAAMRADAMLEGGRPGRLRGVEAGAEGSRPADQNSADEGV